MAAVTLLFQLLPYPHHSEYCSVNIKLFMEFLYPIFHACLMHRFLDVETNPRPLRPVPAVCRLLCSNVRDQAEKNISDLTIASSRYDTLFCSEILISDMHASRVGVAGSRIWSPCLVVPGQDASGPRDGSIRIGWIWSISPTQV